MEIDSAVYICIFLTFGFDFCGLLDCVFGFVGRLFFCLPFSSKKFRFKEVIDLLEGLYMMVNGVPFVHPVLCCCIALGAVVLASVGRKLVQLLGPVVRAVCRLLRYA